MKYLENNTTETIRFKYGGQEYIFEPGERKGCEKHIINHYNMHVKSEHRLDVVEGDSVEKKVEVEIVDKTPDVAHINLNVGEMQKRVKRVTTSRTEAEKDIEKKIQKPIKMTFDDNA